MKSATIIALAFFALIGAVAWLMESPFLFVVGLLMFPTVMQSIPFGLSLAGSQEENEEDGYHGGNSFGFGGKDTDSSE